MCARRGTLTAALHFQPERDILEHRHVTKQCVLLKNEADLTIADGPQGCVLAIEQHLALVRRFQTADDAQQSRFAGARGSEQRHQGAGGNIEIDVLDRGIFAELLGNAA